MKSAFDASVPARKPKTQIGRAITELTSPTESAPEEEPQSVPAATAPAPPPAPPIRETPPPPTPVRRVAESAPVQRGPIGLHQETTHVATEWERLAALRERLALAAEPRSVGSEPQHTAAAVGRVIEELRARLEASVKERVDAAHTLETTRSALARAEIDLERERRQRADIESRADERGQVAAQAVAEAEALASERDLMLSELAERRRLENEQTLLLTDAEEALNRHRSAHETTARELLNMRDLLDLRAAEVVNLENRLQGEVSERARLEARCRQLEAQISHLGEATDALEAIKAMIAPPR
jgi:chromosome segregation ATPase